VTASTVRPRAARRVAAAAFVASLAACAQVDASHDPDEYRRVLDAAMPPIDDVAPNAPLSLEQAMAMAGRHEERLGLSGEDYVQALIDKNRALAAFLPTLSFRPSFVVGDAPPGTGHTEGGGLGATLVHRGDTLQSLDAPVVGHMNVFRGFGDVANLKAVESIIAQRRELLLDLQSTVMLNVAQTYYLVLRAERGVEVLDDSLRLQEARLKDIEQQLANGLATKLAVAQTRAQVDSVRVQLVRAKSDVKNGRATLALVVGAPSVPNPLADTFVVPEKVGDEAAFEREATETRADIVAARHALEAARHDVDAAVAQYYPSVTIDVQGFLRREMYDDSSKWNALLGVNLPIFSAGQIEADVRTAWSRVRQAALSESAVRRAALHDVQTAYENLDESRHRIVELEDEVRSADEAYTQARNAYQNGLGINLDVLAAQDQVLEAKLELAAAQFDRTVFYLDLLRAAGRLVREVAPTVAPAQRPR
jgi:outer membrane protein